MANGRFEVTATAERAISAANYGIALELRDRNGRRFRGRVVEVDGERMRIVEARWWDGPLWWLRRRLRERRSR